MRRPNTYLADAFVNHMDNEEVKLSSKNTDYGARELSQKRQLVIRAIRNLLLCSNIHSDLDRAAVIKLYKKVMSTKSYSSLKEHVYFDAIKNQRLTSISKEFTSSFEGETFNIPKFFNQVEDYNGIYFLSVNNDQASEYQNKLGIVIKGVRDEFEDFYGSKNISLNIPATMDGVERCSHKANAMVIVDPYIFIDDHGRPPKIPNIIKTIKFFIPINLCIPFNISILTRNADNNLLFESKIQQILEGLGAPNVNIEVVAPRNIHDSNRYLFTNYSLMTSGHPFDRETPFNCNFLLNATDEDSLLKRYQDWHNKLVQFSNTMYNTPICYGEIKASFKSGSFSNPLLK